MSKKQWSDDVIQGAANAWEWMNLVISERGMLYGALIYLMIRSNITEFELPNPDTRKSYGENYYIMFKPDEEDNNKATVYLIERPEIEEGE